MACIINSGYSLGCRDSVGGIEFIAISSYDSTTTYVTGTNSIVDSFSPTASFYKYEQYTESSSATQEGTYDNVNGTAFQTQTITLILEDMDSETREKFLALIQARVRVIVKTQTGRYFLFGKVNGGRASASTSGPGQSLGDLAGYNVTLEFKEPEPAIEVDATFAESLIVS